MLWTRFLLLSIITVSESVCPPRELTPNCHCSATEAYYNPGPIQVRCFNLTNPEDLKTQIQVFTGDYGMDMSLSLSYLELPYFSNDTFVGTRIRSLTILNSQLMRFASNGSYVFRGLENFLTSFSIRQSSVTVFWDWRQFGLMENLKYLTIQDCRVNEMNSMMFVARIPLTAFQLDGGDVKMTTNMRLTFSSLATLGIMNHPIESLKREQFPNPAFHLHYVSLRNDSIYFLPSNVFEDMPMLAYIDLSGNHLQTISEQTFTPIIHQLHTLLFQGNPIHCDSSVLWVTRNLESLSDRRCHRLVTNLQSISCETTKQLQGKALSSVLESELASVDNNLK